MPSLLGKYRVMGATTDQCFGTKKEGDATSSPKSLRR